MRLATCRAPSAPWHYEVADTKLARHVKAGAVLQICSYVDQLERIQGRRPEQLHVALGGSARETVSLRVDDYMAYYRRVKADFLAAADEAPSGRRPTRRPPRTRSPSITATSVAGGPTAPTVGEPTTT